MIRRSLVCALALMLGGCSAGLRYILDEYGGIPVREVALSDDTYRVFDKPSASRMMVTSSYRSALNQGLGKGALLGALDTTPPRPLFEAAAMAYLRETGRASCRVTDAYLLVQPQFEVKYDCTPLPAGVVGQAQRKPTQAQPVVAAPPAISEVVAPEPKLSESDRVMMMRD